MSKRDILAFDLVDVNGNYARMFTRVPREFRAELADAVKKTVFSLQRRMDARVPVGPDAPHIKDAIDSTSRGVMGRAGILDGSAPSKGGSKTSMAQVALHNEYAPNKQPFMGNSAAEESKDFGARAKRALQLAERSLTSGVGI